MQKEVFYGNLSPVILGGCATRGPASPSPTRMSSMAGSSRRTPRRPAKTARPAACRRAPRPWSSCPAQPAATQRKRRSGAVPTPQQSLPGTVLCK